jgi:Zn-dependent M28 family amino/carboxypeptidase
MFPRRFLALSVTVFATACAPAPAPPPRPMTLAEMPAFNANRALEDIKKLSSAEFEGRGPGSKGEALTVQYLIDQFKAAGLDPGNPDGSWVQKVPLVGLTGDVAPLVVKKGGVTRSFKVHDEFVPFSEQVTDHISLENSELVFCGYGVQAPEFGWDDFRGLDVKGKTIIVLVGDPPVPNPAHPSELDPGTFGGKAMTLYGRWTYKYDKAAELGAAGVIIVHDTYAAGYGFNVVQQGWSGERFNLVTPDKNMGRAKIESWISGPAAEALFKMAGQDFKVLKAKALSKDFKAVPLGMTASTTITQKMRTVDSQNVVATLPGADPKLKDEYVVFSAHWDHFGIGEPKKDDPTHDKVFHGAADNASGTATILEMARTLKTFTPQPKRSILFLAVTSEEQGLLGSQYYAQFPLYPLSKTLADINVDDMKDLFGRTRDVIVIGLGASDLDDYLREAAREQDRSLRPDAEPEKGFYYRSDHFNFAKVGVPALDPEGGIDVIGKPAGYGQEKRDYYTKNDYHQPSDVVKPDWDLTGFAEDARLLLAVGYRVANANRFPEWKAGNEFKAIREKGMEKK